MMVIGFSTQEQFEEHLRRMKAPEGEMDDQACNNTDREIWREREGDFYADSISVTEGGGIGLHVGGHVIVKPIRDWHKLAAAQEWQDISTAPKNEDVLLGWWSVLGHMWKQEVDLAVSTRGGWRHGNATHWQPLPAPPVAVNRRSPDHKMMTQCTMCGGDGATFKSRQGSNDPDVWNVVNCEACGGSGNEITARRTIKSSDNPAVLGGVRAKNNGRYNGNGRHWATPAEVFDPLHAEFAFTLDPCATRDSAKCLTYFTEEQNGLEQSWSGHRVFMNPPYGREVYAWTKKAREESARGAFVVGLLPASTDLAWWHNDVVGHAEVRYLRGRVRFLTGGPYRASGFFASVVVIWGAANIGKHHD